MKGHPLLMTLDDIIQDGNAITSIHVSPLDINSLNRLVADTMHCDPDISLPLANLLQAKTGGNPFFTNEFLLTLHQENILDFDPATGRWTWDIEHIKEMDVTDNVVQLMSHKIQKLPEQTREAVKLASCLGNTFSLKDLSVIYKQSGAKIAEKLEKALQEGLLIPLNDAYKYLTEGISDTLDVGYKFLHDRVQQAAYGMNDEETRQNTHLSIGRMLLNNMNPEEQGENVIDIVRHLNEGRTKIEAESERLIVARFNLQAGMKAGNAAAWQLALHYIEVGRELLPAHAWERCYDLTFALSREYARYAYLTGRFEEAEQQSRNALHHAQTNLKKIEILLMQTIQYTFIGKPEDAMRVGLRGLSLLGIHLSEKPGQIAILREVVLTKWNLGGRKIADLVHAPELVQADTKLAIEMLMEIAPATYVTGNEELMGMVVLKITNLSLRYGNCPGSAFAYATYAVLLSAYFGQMKAGYEFGKVAVALHERFQDIRLRCRVLFCYTIYTHHWHNHWKTSAPLFKKGIDAGYQSGDLYYLAYCAANVVMWDPTLDLDTMCQEMETSLKIIESINSQDVGDTTKLYLQLYRNLRGVTDTPYVMTPLIQDALRRIRRRKYVMGIAVYHITQAEIDMMYEQYAEAIQNVRDCDSIVHTLVGTQDAVKFCFVAFLAFAGAYPDMPPKEQARAWKRLKKEHRKMKAWARYGPMNFLHRQLLMEAEMARLSGKPYQAAELYEQSFTTAKANEWRCDEALVCELSAKFYLSRNQVMLARVYMQEARNLYRNWGANAKVRHLDKTYRELLFEQDGCPFGTISPERNRMTQDRGESALPHKTTNTSTSSRTTELVLDLPALMKASQAISGEIVLEKLLQRMLRIVIENAGAQEGFLMLEQEGQWEIAGDSLGSTHRESPTAIINYVIRTHEPVVLNDAAQAGQFRNNPYILAHQPKSLLCTPLLNQGQLRGILYLENNLTIGAFTLERLDILNLLSSQAAISIENARLYDQLAAYNRTLEQKVAERTHTLADNVERLHREIEERQRVEAELHAAKTEAESANNAKSEFLAHMSHELRTPLNGILGYAQLLGQDNALTEDQQSGLRIIQRSGQHLLNLIDDILNLSKIEARKMELHSIEVALPEFLHDISALMTMRAQQKGLDFHYAPDSNLPAIILTDRQRLEQVLLNLLNNAVKFTEQGSVTLEILDLGFEILDLEEGGQSKISNLKFKISDTGIGIPADKLTAIFDPFERVAGHTQAVEGTGLGLAISRQLVQLMGGRIEVSSQPGQGSTFCFELALPVKASPAIAASPAINTRIGFEGSCKVLIVDDLPSNRSLLGDILRPLGFDLREAGDGASGIAAAIEFQPDVIILDLMLPGIDGAETARRLRQIETLQDTVLIGCSASVSQAIRDRMLSCGCHDFLPKPVQYDRLLDCLEEHLTLRWQYRSHDEQQAAGRKGLDETEITLPSREDLQILYDFTQRGDILEIEAYAKQLAVNDPVYANFADKLIHWRKNLDIHAIRQYLEKSLP